MHTKTLVLPQDQQPYGMADSGTGPELFTSPLELPVLLGSCGISLLIFILSIWLLAVLMKAVARIPVEHRPYPPGLVFLSLIPCFNVVWAWFLGVGIPRGLAAAFEERGMIGASSCAVSGLVMAVIALVTFVASVVLSVLGSIGRASMLAEQDQVIGAVHFIPDFLAIGASLLSFVCFAYFVGAVNKTSKQLLD